MLQPVGVIVVVEIRRRGATATCAASLGMVPNNTNRVHTSTKDSTVHLPAGCLGVLALRKLARAVLTIFSLSKVGLVFVQRSEETEGAVEVVDSGASVQVTNKQSRVALRPSDANASSLDFHVLHALFRGRGFLPRAHLHKAITQVAHSQFVPLDVHHLHLAHARESLHQVRLGKAAGQVTDEKNTVLFRFLLRFLILRQAAVVLSLVLVLVLLLMIMLLVMMLLLMLLVRLLWRLLVLLVLLMLLVGMLAVVLLCGIRELLHRISVL